MTFDSHPAGLSWFRVSHETAVKKLTRDIVMGGLPEGSTLKVAYSRDYWQEPSVPHHVGFSIGLLESCHHKAAGFSRVNDLIREIAIRKTQ